MAREQRKTSINWKLWGGVAGLTLVCVTSALAGRKVREFAMTDPQFELSRERTGALTVEGLQYTSRWKVQRIFAGDFGRSVFAVPVAERRRRLLAIDWVEEASVSRVWPDRLVVRLRERTPVAFVSLRSGVLLIDSYGVFLDQPAQARFTFPVLSGIREDSTEVQRRVQVRALLQLQQELGSQAKDISEVNVADVENLRVVAHVDNDAMELILGDGNFARRYQNFLNHLPDIRKGSPGVRVFDLRLENRITAKAIN